MFEEMGLATFDFRERHDARLIFLTQLLSYVYL